MDKCISAAVALLFCASLPSTVSALTGRDDLKQWCTQGSVAGAGRCFGFLLAAEDALSLGSVNGIRACLPKNIGLSEQHQIALTYLSKQPATRREHDEPALMQVVLAYAEAYPCPD